VGFFDGNPALDIPPSPPAACQHQHGDVTGGPADRTSGLTVVEDLSDTPGDDRLAR
jgi:hypothetical protein